MKRPSEKNLMKKKDNRKLTFDIQNYNENFSSNTNDFHHLKLKKNSDNCFLTIQEESHSAFNISPFLSKEKNFNFLQKKGKIINSKKKIL